MIGLLVNILSLFFIFFSSCDGAGCCGPSSRSALPWILLTRENAPGGAIPDCFGAVIGRDRNKLRVQYPASCGTGIDQKVARFLEDEEDLTLSGHLVPTDGLFTTVTYTKPRNVIVYPTHLPDHASESQEWLNGRTVYYDSRTSQWTIHNARVIGNECYQITSSLEIDGSTYFCVLVPSDSQPFITGTPYFTSARYLVGSSRWFARFSLRRTGRGSRLLSCSAQWSMSIVDPRTFTPQ